MTTATREFSPHRVQVMAEAYARHHHYGPDRPGYPACVADATRVLNDPDHWMRFQVIAVAEHRLALEAPAENPEEA
jgi:hypothetical protein